MLGIRKNLDNKLLSSEDPSRKDNKALNESFSTEKLNDLTCEEKSDRNETTNDFHILETKVLQNVYFFII